MRSHGKAVILIVGLCAFVFANALHNDLQWDDRFIISENPGIRELTSPLKFFTRSYWVQTLANYQGLPGRGYRPVPEFLFAVDYALWRLNPVGYHATSLLVHTANSVLLYFLAHRAFRDGRIAAFCALLFAVHPVHVEAVVWAKARPELLALLFMLGAMLLYARYLDAPSSSRPVPFAVCGVLLFGLAVVSKASAVVLPGLLAVYLWCFVPRERLRRGLLALLPFVGVMVGFLAVRAVMPHRPPQVMVPEGLLFWTGVAVLGMYLKLLLVPIGLCAQHAVSLVADVHDPSVFRAVALGLPLLGGAVAALWRSRAAFFALAWIILSMIPLMALNAVGRLVGENRAYIPSVGFCLLAGLLLGSIPALASKRLPRASLERTAIALCVLLICIYAGLTVVRNMDWANELSLWTDTLRKNPDSWVGHQVLGMMYVEKGLPGKAVPHLEREVELYPQDLSARYQLARAYQQTGREEQAVATFNALLTASPADVRTRAELAALYGRMGHDEAAMAEFQRALRDAPQTAVVHRLLGIFHVHKGQYEEALPALTTALQLKPDSPSAHHALGVVYEKTGSPERALAEYRRAAELRPESVESWLAMGALYERLGDIGSAIRSYQKCADRPGPLADQARAHVARLAGN
jgi:Flp pilus assembly protein TadD